MNTKTSINKNIVLLFSILIITTWQCIDIYLPSMPSMTVALSTTPTMIQLTITIAMIAYGSVALLYGPLSDYYGRRIIALVGLGIFVTGSILCLFAFNIYVLLVGRMLQGFGFASACGVAAPAISDVFAGEELVKACSYVGMAMAVTPIFAPVLGGYLHDYFNWHAPFVFLLLYSTIIFFLFFRFFPETKKSLKQGSLHPLQIIRGYFSILQNPKYIGLVLCLVLVFTGEISYIITAPFLFQTKLGFTPVQNGWLIIITVGGLLAGSFTSSKACKKFNIEQLLKFGCVITILGAATMFIFALLGKTNIATIILPMMLYMYGAGIIYPNAVGGCMSCFPEKTGAVCSLAAMFQTGTTGLIATVGTHLFNIGHLPLASTLLILAILTIPALCLIKLKILKE